MGRSTSAPTHDERQNSAIKGGNKGNNGGCMHNLDLQPPSPTLLGKKIFGRKSFPPKKLNTETEAIKRTCVFSTGQARARPGPTASLLSRHQAQFLSHRKPPETRKSGCPHHWPPGR